MPWRRCPDRSDVKARLEVLLARVRKLRQNLYPEGWDADPLLQVEKELQQLIREGK